MPQEETAEDQPEPEARRLGSWEIDNDGETLRATFKGQGFVTFGHVNGSLLANRRLRDRRDIPEKSLSFESMFPENWEDKGIEYEITVKAKRVTNLPESR